MGRGKNIPCNAGCSRGIKFERRPVQYTDPRTGRPYTVTESVPVECRTCDGSGTLHVPGDDER